MCKIDKLACVTELYNIIKFILLLMQNALKEMCSTDHSYSY